MMITSENHEEQELLARLDVDAMLDKLRPEDAFILQQRMAGETWQSLGIRDTKTRASLQLRVKQALGFAIRCKSCGAERAATEYLYHNQTQCRACRLAANLENDREYRRRAKQTSE